MTVRMGGLTWAAAALALLGCDSGGDSDADCRQAAAACAPGFVCRAFVDRFECVAEGDGGGAGGAGGGGAGGVGGGAGGAGGEAGAGGAGGGEPDDRTDLSNIRVRLPDGAEAPRAEDGEAYIAYVSQSVRVTFDYALRADPACESCRSQLVLLVDGVAGQCMYDGSPGLGGVTDRVDGTLPIAPDRAAGPLILTWKRLDEPDCEDALAVAAAAPGPGGPLALLDVRQPLGPFRYVGEERINIDGGDTAHCFTRVCPEGTYALTGAGEIGGEHDLIGDRATDDRTWERCFMPERADVPVRNAAFQVACGEAPGAEVVRFETEGAAPQDAEFTQRVACPEGFQALHGGGSWPFGWKVAERGYRVGPDGTQSFILRGRGTAGAVRAQVTCARGIPPLRLVEHEAILEPGGQCGRVDCADAEIAIGGGGVFFDPLELESIGPVNQHFHTCGLNRMRPELALPLQARCLPR